MAMDRDEMRHTIVMLAENNEIEDILEAIADYLDHEASGIRDDKEREPWATAAKLVHQAYMGFVQ